VVTEVDQLLDQRFERIRAAESDKSPDQLFANQERDTAAAGDLCIQLEFLAGLESPKECSDARMKYQVDRLSQTLADASSRMPVMDELHAIETRWYSLGPLEPAEIKPLQQRFDLCVSDIVQQNA
jgi:hypothetical protein